MKSIFYVGAALMLGASVYGFVDYKKAKSKKEFNELYNSKEMPGPEATKAQPAAFDDQLPAEIERTKSVRTDQQEPTKIEKAKSAGMEQNVSTKIEKTEPAVAPEKSSLMIENGIETTTLEEKLSPTTGKTTAVGKKYKHGKKKKLSYKLFTRAAPREMYVPPTAKPVEKPTTKSGNR